MPENVRASLLNSMRLLWLWNANRKVDCVHKFCWSAVKRGWVGHMTEREPRLPAGWVSSVNAQDTRYVWRRCLEGLWEAPWRIQSAGWSVMEVRTRFQILSASGANVAAAWTEDVDQFEETTVSLIANNRFTLYDEWSKNTQVNIPSLYLAWRRI